MKKFILSFTTGLFLLGCITDVFAQPANDNVCGAVSLTVNTTTYLSTTNVGATATAGIPAPDCGNYINGDVWYSVVVPSNGNIVIDLQAGTLTDAGMALYSATSCSGPLTLINCSDNYCSATMPVINQAGLTAGNTVYIRVWGVGSGNYGTFGIRVAEPTLGDCFGSVPLCTATYSTTQPYTSGGNINELATTTSWVCLLTGEHYSKWFTFTVGASGNLWFSVNTADDYDWALYNLSNNTCEDIFTGLAPVRCNYSATAGNTGCNSSGVNPSEGGSGSAWCSPVAVTAGQRYALLIDNYSGGGSGFSLSFTGGTAGIDVSSPALVADTTTVAFNSTTLTFNLNKPVYISSVSASDFTFSGPGGTYSITNLTGSGCEMGKTFTIIVSPAMTSG
ncbi:MAG: hypothetical protein HY958_04220 [Bacteroidia bacterium]|nr:hypothetical protein [Bacteroidia bacterium]